MRLLLIAGTLLVTTSLYAQKDMGWMAPEGKILNYRTLTWNDFLGREEMDFAKKLAEQNLAAKAYVCPAIYFKADSGKIQDNGRVKFQFQVKCAFQSKAFVRESTKEEKSDYVLIHEQDHYDIALTYANKLQADLSARDYSKDRYSEEIDKIHEDISNRHRATQERYDAEVNPDGKDDKEKQHLWDMRIKKGMDHITDEYYGAAESVVRSVTMYGQTVKRMPGEPALQFAVRARPLYTEFPEEMTSKILEHKEWGQEPAVLAFYTHKYYVADDAAQLRDNYLTLAYMFLPAGKDVYRRVLVDSFSNEGRPVKITVSFLANADTDQAKELVIMAASPQRDKQRTGTMYINRVYDNVGRLLPGRLTRLDDAGVKIAGGFDGQIDGKPSKAKYKTEKEVADALKKPAVNSGAGR